LFTQHTRVRIFGEQTCSEKADQQKKKKRKKERKKEGSSTERNFIEELRQFFHLFNTAQQNDLEKEEKCRVFVAAFFSSNFWRENLNLHGIEESNLLSSIPISMTL
jgi:hypothetical protein